MQAFPKHTAISLKQSHHSIERIEVNGYDIKLLSEFNMTSLCQKYQTNSIY